MKKCEVCFKEIHLLHPHAKYCKDCCRKKIKEWYHKHYQKNKFKILTKHAEYRSKNDEKIKKIQHDYYLKNREKVLEKNRKHFLENPEYYQRYRIQNKERISKHNKEWRNKNQPIISKKKKEHYANNRETIIKKVRDYTTKNLKRIKQKRKIYYSQNKDILRKKLGEWKKRNPSWKKDYYWHHRTTILQQRKEYRLKKPEIFKKAEERYKPKRKIIDKIKYERWKLKENETRKKQNLPLVGEGYVKEKLMKRLLESLFPQELHKDNGRYNWLQGMELDRFYPRLNLAFEYQGEGHFKEIPFFRGNLKEFQQRDAIKRELCQTRGIILIEIAYFESLNEQLILQKLKDKNITTNQTAISKYI